MDPFEDLPLRDELRGLTPYGAPQIDVPVRLNTNENPYPVPEAVAESIEKALRGLVRDLNRYPDRDALALREDLANYVGHGTTAANIWVGNGSNEVQLQALLAFGGQGRTAMGFSPSYSMHPMLAKATATSWLDGHRTRDFQLGTEQAKAQVRVFQPDVVFVCSPNNPTGSAITLETVAAIASETPGVVIVDEAYVEFAREGTRSAVELIPRFPRLLVTRTLSKAFGLAGARIGYLIGRPHAIEYLQLVRMPYHLSSLAQAAARAALAHSAAFLSQVEAIKAQRDRIITGLRELGLHPVDSDANFVLFGEFRDEKAVWQALLDHGVLVRDVGISGHLRVCAGTAEETDAFLRAMGQLPDGS
ncbi:MAG TPA: histidinol-phosphate transaminase [Micromonosporaceae bacterium]